MVERNRPVARVHNLDGVPRPELGLIRESVKTPANVKTASHPQSLPIRVIDLFHVLAGRLDLLSILMRVVSGPLKILGSALGAGHHDAAGTGFLAGGVTNSPVSVAGH
jgi:hypothetical protein